MTISNPRLHWFVSDVIKWQVVHACSTYTMSTQFWRTMSKLEHKIGLHNITRDTCHNGCVKCILCWCHLLYCTILKVPGVGSFLLGVRISFFGSSDLLDNKNVKKRWGMVGVSTTTTALFCFSIRYGSTNLFQQQWNCPRKQHFKTWTSKTSASWFVWTWTFPKTRHWRHYEKSATIVAALPTIEMALTVNKGARSIVLMSMSHLGRPHMDKRKPNVYSS